MSWSEFISDVYDEISEFVEVERSAETPWDVLASLRGFPQGTDFLENERFFRGDKSSLRCGKNCVIKPTTEIEGDVVLGDNVFIGSHCLLRGPMFIGSNSIIGRGHEITRSIILSGTNMGHSSVILDSIIGKNCWLAAFVGTCNKRLDGKPITAFWNDTQVTLAPETSYGCTIGHRVRLGVSISVQPGASIANDYLIYGPRSIQLKEWDH